MTLSAEMCDVAYKQNTAPPFLGCEGLATDFYTQDWSLREMTYSFLKTLMADIEDKILSILAK